MVVLKRFTGLKTRRKRWCDALGVPVFPTVETQETAHPALAAPEGTRETPSSRDCGGDDGEHARNVSGPATETAPLSDWQSATSPTPLGRTAHQYTDAQTPDLCCEDGEILAQEPAGIRRIESPNSLNTRLEICHGIVMRNMFYTKKGEPIPIEAVYTNADEFDERGEYRSFFERMDAVFRLSEQTDLARLYLYALRTLFKFNCMGKNCAGFKLECSRDVVYMKLFQSRVNKLFLGAFARGSAHPGRPRSYPEDTASVKDEVTSLDYTTLQRGLATWGSQQCSQAATSNIPQQIIRAALRVVRNMPGAENLNVREFYCSNDEYFRHGDSPRCKGQPWLCMDMVCRDYADDIARVRWLLAYRTLVKCDFCFPDKYWDPRTLVLLERRGQETIQFEEDTIWI